ncbi:iron complex transport system substrate-binding protein [Zymomonas mobilis]|uniref:ABC transporter substrate-binding protein n=1 Tax=Zymomonas mobilis TaxID=542 RepID=UPI000B36B80F|nr:ABC transporter substrate-binding protein [Zymomonas mobilis]ART92836.1 iron ABC transporter [Zymomonas mobilis subsp. mobilis]TWD59494.1 iron complex transport system substrate-binding protein [Zymomonas mobilis]
MLELSISSSDRGNRATISRPLYGLTLILIFCCLFTSSANSTDNKPPRRIVSLNLCADELLVALADRPQIAALTRYARNPDMSLVSKEAQSLPFTYGGAEELLRLHPDLVITSSYSHAEILPLLKERQVKIIDLPLANSLADIIAQIRIVALAVGHPERGEAVIQKMEKELRTLPPPMGHGRTAAYYQRQGYLSGTGSLIDDMMNKIGLKNLANNLNKSALSRLSLEEIVTYHPDFLIMGQKSYSTQDIGSQMLQHPLLKQAIPASHRLFIPAPLTLCGSPHYPEAIKILNKELETIDHPSR